MLELEGQQNFVNFARVGFLGRQVNIACDLHGDGRGALAFDPPQVGNGSPQNAFVIDAAVLIKTRIFDGQHRIGHDFGDLRNGRELAPLLTKFANQRAFQREHPQRQLGPVVGQLRDIWQVWIGHRQGHCQQHQHRQYAGGGKTQAPQGNTQQPAPQPGA